MMHMIGMSVIGGQILDFCQIFCLNILVFIDDYVMNLLN